MIPYFQYNTIPFGPLHIQVWGLFVALGIAAAFVAGFFEVRRRGLDRNAYFDLSALMLVAAIVGARLVYAAIYDPGPFLDEPSALLRLWDGGLSIYGGFFAAAAAAAVFLRRRRMPFLAYADVYAFILPLGCSIGRLGCFFIHDHPGVLSRSFLAVDYPGGARFDHGLLLAMVGLLIFVIFLVLRRRQGGVQTPFFALFLLLYGLIRFGLDFLRAWDLPQADVRYLWLTPAQYFSAAVVAAGLALLIKARSANAVPQAK